MRQCKNARAVSMSGLCETALACGDHARLSTASLPLGVEVYKGKPVFYGLGSFSFHTGAAVTPTTIRSAYIKAPQATNRCRTLRCAGLIHESRTSGGGRVPCRLAKGQSCQAEDCENPSKARSLSLLFWIAGDTRSRRANGAAISAGLPLTRSGFRSRPRGRTCSNPCHRGTPAEPDRRSRSLAAAVRGTLRPI
jgi:hypothetical protein